MRARGAMVRLMMEALRRTQTHSDARRRTQTHADALRRHQSQSDALRRTQGSLSAYWLEPAATHGRRCVVFVLVHVLNRVLVLVLVVLVGAWHGRPAWRGVAPCAPSPRWSPTATLGRAESAQGRLRYPARHSLAAHTGRPPSIQTLEPLARSRRLEAEGSRQLGDERVAPFGVEIRQRRRVGRNFEAAEHGKGRMQVRTQRVELGDGTPRVAQLDKMMTISHPLGHCEGVAYEGRDGGRQLGRGRRGAESSRKLALELARVTKPSASTSSRANSDRRAAVAAPDGPGGTPSASVAQ